MSDGNITLVVAPTIIYFNKNIMHTVHSISYSSVTYTAIHNYRETHRELQSKSIKAKIITSSVVCVHWCMRVCVVSVCLCGCACVRVTSQHDGWTAWEKTKWYVLESQLSLVSCSRQLLRCRFDLLFDKVSGGRPHLQGIVLKLQALHPLLKHLHDQY